jgi:hypothetical protein
MKHVMDLMNIDRGTHAPPVLSFEWTGFASLFPDGRPSRGQMHVTFRESLTVQELLHQAGRE